MTNAWEKMKIWIMEGDHPSGERRLIRNPEMVPKNGSVSASLFGALGVFAHLFLFIAENLCWVTPFIVAYMRGFMFDEIIGITLLAYGYRRFIHLLTRPALRKAFGEPISYVFSDSGLTIEALKVGCSSIRKYMVRRDQLTADFSIPRDRGFATGACCIRFKNTGLGDADPFNQWLSFTAAISLSCEEDLIETAAEVVEVLGDVQKTYTSLKLEQWIDEIRFASGENGGSNNPVYRARNNCNNRRRTVA